MILAEQAGAEVAPEEFELVAEVHCLERQRLLAADRRLVAHKGRTLQCHFL